MRIQANNPWALAARTAVLLLCLEGETSAAHWPRLGGSEGAFVSPETGLLRAWPTDGPRLLWQVELGQGFAGAAVWGKQVYVLDRPNNRQDALRCFHLDTGREEWRWSYDAPGVLPYPGSRNVPTVDEEYIFALGPFGHFSCLNRRTHEVIWIKHLVHDFEDPEVDRATPPTGRIEQLARAQVPQWGVAQAPLLWRDTVIVAPQTEKVGLVAYEKSTGTTRWQSGYIGRNWYSHISPGLTRLCGVQQIIMMAQPSDPEKAPAQAPPALISSLDPGTGRILWMTQTPGPHKIPVPQPLAVGEDRLFISGGYGMGCAMLQIACTNGQWSTRVLFHNKTVAAHIHSPVLYRDRIYVASLKEQGGIYSGLVCLDKEGRLLWQTGPSLQFQDGGMLLADGLVLIMHGRSGVLHLLELTATGYALLAEAPVLGGRQIWAPLALSQGKLLVRDQRQMKCLEVSEASP